MAEWTHEVVDGLDYGDCLRAAGYDVVAYQEFGSYQGDWWAKVVKPTGERGWVHGYFGSCSGCDAIQATFGYGFGKDGQRDDGVWVVRFTDEEWERVAEFGAGEADEFYAQADAETEASAHSSWDLEAGAVVAFIRDNAWEAP